MQRRAQLTRQTVLEGAAASFEKLGYGTASLSTILANAGVSKGAMYFHFSSKEDLARAVIDAQHEMAMEGCRRVVAASSSALEAMVLVSQEMARQLVTEPIARGGMRLTLEAGSIAGPITAPYLEWIDAVSGLAKQAIADGDLHESIDPDVLGRFVCGAFTGVQMVSEVLTGRSDLYQRLSEMWSLLLPGIVPARLLDGVLSLAATPPAELAADDTHPGEE